MKCNINRNIFLTIEFVCVFVGICLSMISATSIGCGLMGIGFLVFFVEKYIENTVGFKK